MGQSSGWFSRRNSTTPLRASLTRSLVIFFTTIPSITAVRQLWHWTAICCRTCGKFCQAGAAFTSTALKLAVVAHGRRSNISADLAGSLEDSSSRLNLNGDVVDGYVKQFFFFSHYLRF